MVQAGAGTNLIPDGLVINPSGSTLYIGGNDTMAFSVANGAVLWTSGGAWGSAVFGLSGSEARVLRNPHDQRGHHHVRIPDVNLPRRSFAGR